MTNPRPTSKISPSPILRALFAVRDGDGRMQHVLEQLAGAAFLVVPRTGGVLAVNGRAVSLTEWSREELLGRSLAELVAAPAAAEALEQIHQLEPGHVRNLTSVALRTRSGRPAVVDLRLSALAEVRESDTVVLMVATPAEDRLTAERAASAHKRALEGLEQLVALFARPGETDLDTAVELIRDMLGGDAAGLYTVAPDQPGIRLCARTTGLRSFPPVLGPSEAQHLQAPTRWVSSQRPEGSLHQAARAAGWAQLLGNPVGDPKAAIGAVVVAYRPGTPVPQAAEQWLSLAAQHLNQLMQLIQRQAAHQRAHDLALRLSAQLAAVNAQIEEGVVLLNPNGTVDEINGAAAKILGYRSEDVTGLPYGDVLIGEPQLADLIQRALEQPESDLAYEGQLFRRNGQGFPGWLRGRALPDGSRLTTLRDLSESRANEIQQEHLSQLAYAGQALSTFAHDVRSPLNNIGMGVQYLAAYMKPNEELAQALGKIQAECTRLSALMNDMLAWAKPVVPEFAPTDMEAVLKRLLNRVSMKISQRAVVGNLTADPDCPPVLADARLLDRVFINLIDNALQAMPAGGQLSLRLTHADRGASGHVVEVSVVDSGPGLSEEAKRNIFDPYFTTKPDGTGLGLSICRRLVTVHRGAIRVDTLPDSGTAFTVTLPALEPAGGAGEPRAPADGAEGQEEIS